MKSPLPVVFRQNQHILLAESAAEGVDILSNFLREPDFDLLVNLGHTTSFRLFGTPASCVLVQEGNGVQQAYSLSKRRQTPQAVTTGVRSETHPHHRILQRDDVQLILTCVINGEPVPDAYHLEPFS